MPSKRKTQNVKCKIIAALITLPILFALTGCENGNLFGRFHKKGSVGDVPTLLADAKTAMVNHEYNNAQEYFKRIVQQQPGNSEALLGYAQASLPTAGLDLGTIISNIIRSQSGAPATVAEYDGFSGVLSAAGTPNIGSDDILSGLEQKISSLRIVVGLDDPDGSGLNAISALEKIVKGQGDGIIPTDDPTTNINLTIAYVLRSVLRVVDFLHIKSSNFDVSIDQSGVDCSLATETLRDIKRAFHRVKAVALKLNVASTSTIAQVKTDAQTMLNDLKLELAAKGCSIDPLTDGDINVDPL